MTIIGRLRGLWACRYGGMSLEFALIAPTLFLLFLGIFEFGRLMWVRNALQFAAEETGRYVIINPTASPTQISAYLKGRIPSVNPASISVTAPGQVVGGVNFITVTATHNFSFVADAIGIAPISLVGQARVPAIP
jgi:Flp pilus assembly protein TadG